MTQWKIFLFSFTAGALLSICKYNIVRVLKKTTSLSTPSQYFAVASREITWPCFALSCYYSVKKTVVVPRLKFNLTSVFGDKPRRMLCFHPEDVNCKVCRNVGKHCSGVCFGSVYFLTGNPLESSSNCQLIMEIRVLWGQWQVFGSYKKRASMLHTLRAADSSNIAIFWVVTLPDYTALQPRRQPSSY
jgi:hypothetical protein